MVVRMVDADIWVKRVDFDLEAISLASNEVDQDAKNRRIVFSQPLIHVHSFLGCGETGLNPAGTALRTMDDFLKFESLGDVGISVR